MNLKIYFGLALVQVTEIDLCLWEQEFHFDSHILN